MGQQANSAFHPFEVGVSSASCNYMSITGVETIKRLAETVRVVV